MIRHSSMIKVAMGAAVAATALTAILPAAALAQNYGPSSQRTYDAQGGYYYDGCQRSQNNRAVGGGLAGAAAGAIVGGNVASRKTRDEGAILGGVLGAVVGSQIGKSTAACDRDQRQQVYADPYANQGYAQTYAAPPPPPAYDPGYDPRYDRSYGYDSYAYDSTRSVNDCTMVESRARMPDGGTKTQMVQACRDSRGEWQFAR